MDKVNYINGQVVDASVINQAINENIDATNEAKKLVLPVDNSQANNIGVASLSIGANGNLIAKNLKGSQGDPGINSALLSNNYGNSNQNGYTQFYINDKKADKSELKNQNLLINGDFTINQKEQSSYSGLGYGFSMWRSLSSTITISKSTSGVTINQSTDNFGIIIQPILEINKFKGKTITLSINCLSTNAENYLQIYSNDNAGYYKSVVFSTVGNHSLTFTIPNDITQLMVRLLIKNGTTNLEYIKLENGNTATNNSITNKSIELHKCQYYMQMLKYCRVRASLVIPNLIDFCISLPTPMRIKPTIDYTNFSVVSLTGLVQSGFTFSNISAENTNQLMIRATKTEHGLSDASLFISNNSLLDSNIY